MMRALLSLLLACGVAAGAPAQTASGPAAPAAAATTPYSATVPVAGTSDAQRNAAISMALSQVLQQVSPDFSAAPDVLAQASGYVRDYHYRRAASGGLELQVDFDPGAIGRIMARRQKAAAGLVGGGTPGAATSAAAAATAAGGTATLWVDGIDDSQAFAALLSLLRSDSALHGVIPVAAEGNGILLRLTSDQPLATVVAGLTGPGAHLAPAPRPRPGVDQTLHWVP